MRSKHISSGVLAIGIACWGCTGEILGIRLGTKAKARAIPVASPPAELAATSGLRRLSAYEYDNALRELLRDNTRPGQILLPQDPRTPFDNDFTQQVASESLVASLAILAQDATQRLLADPVRRDAVIGCKPSGPGDVACFNRFVQHFGRLALRRPLEAGELSRLSAFIQFGIDAGDFNSAVETAILTLLQHHEFTYRIELGTPVADKPGLTKLNDFELAARLAFFLWASPPDDALLDRAQAGELASADGVRAAVVAMLADPRSRAQVSRFHALWLNFERLPFSPELSSAMSTETNALINRVVFDDNRPWQDLFRMDETYVNDALATHYGLPPPGTSAPQWVHYPADSKRLGILSHGAFLSVGGRFGDTSPTQRGLSIRTRLFCQDIPPPPPDVNVDNPPEAATPSACKVDRYLAHASGACVNCHGAMDPIGFGLENFDLQGRYRTTEPDHPECAIGGVGEVKGVGRFSGPAELADLLIQSGELNRCIISQVYRFVMGRGKIDDVDGRFIADIGARLGGKTATFRWDEMLSEILTSEAFRHRRELP